MKVFQWNNIVAGLLVLMFALILAVDALLVTWGQPGIPLSDNDVKGITGITFVIIAGFILVKARESKYKTNPQKQQPEKKNRPCSLL
jgi:hypothetical protein